MKPYFASAPMLALRAGKTTAAPTFFGWIDATPAAELREARAILAVGGGPDGEARMLREAGGFLDPRRGTFTTTMNLPFSETPGRFAANCREAVTRIDARLAGRSMPAAANAVPVKATTPAPKAAAAPVAPKATTEPAKPLFGLERVAAIFKAEAANRKGGK
jgi:hypothetical protein